VVTCSDFCDVRAAISVPDCETFGVVAWDVPKATQTGQRHMKRCGVKWLMKTIKRVGEKDGELEGIKRANEEGNGEGGGRRCGG
jgi:hypothetical protein